MSKIIYGEGIVSIDPTVEVRAFDIHFSGQIQATCNLPSHWVIQSNDKRIIGYSMGDSMVQLTDILEYTGYLKIQHGSVVTRKEEIPCTVENNASDLFDDSKVQFDTSSSKLDELDKTYLNKRQRHKTSIRQINLTTKHGEYYYAPNKPVPEGISYHINTRQRHAMTLEPNSVEIFPLLGDGRIFNLKKIKRKRPLNIHPKKLKSYVQKIKAKASSGTRGPKTGKDTQRVAGTAYTGGGSE